MNAFAPRIAALLLTAITATSLLAQDEKEIVAARERGVKFLQSVQKSDGRWEYKGHDLGITALCTIALIENGVPLEHDSVQKGYNYVKKNYRDLGNTYDLALGVVCLSRFGDRRDKPMIRELAARLMAGQKDSGGWHYSCPKDIDPERVLRDPVGVKLAEGFGDNSCTQFAVLGLWVASRSGVNIDKTLERVAKRFDETQKEDGGWAYDAREEVKSGSPSMTSAGLFCMAVAEAHRIREQLKSSGKSEAGTTTSLMENQTFKRAFTRTGQFAPAVAGGTQRYFMWSIERVGVLLGLEKIGNTEWYKAGSAGLLKEQKEAGNWAVTGPGSEVDTDGLADTSFALLFLRKANLGSDISRLLEGETEEKFENLTQKKKFKTLQEAITAAKPGDTVRIDGAGPYMAGNLELKDITLQAGFGVTPVLKFEVGKNRLGIRLRPERDADARNLITVTGGKVTLEGLKIQIDPPAIKPPVPFTGVMVKAGTVRILNCTISETNKQGSAGVTIAAPGQHVIRNSLLVGGRAGVELIGAKDPQELLFDNSVTFSNAGFRVVNDPTKKLPAAVKINIRKSVVQAKEVVESPKVIGSIAVNSTMSVYQAEALGSNFLVTEKDTMTRSWSGSINLYDVKSFIGVAGKPVASITDATTWSAFWKNADKEVARRVAPFLGVQQLGNFSHEANVQTWTIELPETAEGFLQRVPIGINAYIAGSGGPYDQYRDTYSYTEWTKGELGLSPTALTSAGGASSK